MAYSVHNTNDSIHDTALTALQSHVTRPVPREGRPVLSRARGGLAGYGMWSRVERLPGPRATLPLLPSLTEASAATDPAQRMHAAILQAGVAILDHHAPFETSWMVPVEGGEPLHFSHAPATD
jgi:hypothetical protein